MQIQAELNAFGFAEHTLERDRITRIDQILSGQLHNPGKQVFPVVPKAKTDLRRRDFLHFICQNRAALGLFQAVANRSEKPRRVENGYVPVQIREGHRHACLRPDLFHHVCPIVSVQSLNPDVFQNDDLRGTHESAEIESFGIQPGCHRANYRAAAPRLEFTQNLFELLLHGFFATGNQCIGMAEIRIVKVIQEWRNNHIGQVAAVLLPLLNMKTDGLIENVQKRLDLFHLRHKGRRCIHGNDKIRAGIQGRIHRQVIRNAPVYQERLPKCHRGEQTGNGNTRPYGRAHGPAAKNVWFSGQNICGHRPERNRQAVEIVVRQVDWLGRQPVQLLLELLPRLQSLRERHLKSVYVQDEKFAVDPGLVVHIKEPPVRKIVKKRLPVDRGDNKFDILRGIPDRIQPADECPKAGTDNQIDGHTGLLKRAKHTDMHTTARPPAAEHNRNAWSDWLASLCDVPWIYGCGSDGQGKQNCEKASCESPLN